MSSGLPANESSTSIRVFLNELTSLESTLLRIERERDSLEKSIQKIEAENEMFRTKREQSLRAPSEKSPNFGAKSGLLSQKSLANDSEFRSLPEILAAILPANRFVDDEAPQEPPNLFEPKPYPDQSSLIEYLRRSTTLNEELIKEITKIHTSAPHKLSASQDISSNVIDDLFLYTIDESRLGGFKQRGWVSYTTHSALGEKPRGLDQKAPKYIVPFRRVLSTQKVEANFKSLSQILYRDQALQRGLDIGCVAFPNSKNYAVSVDEFEMEVNPKGSVFYYFIKTEDFVISPETSDPAKDFLVFDFFQKFIVIKTLRPLSHFFSELLIQLNFSMRKERAELFSSLTQRGEISAQQTLELSSKKFLQSDLLVIKDLLRKSREWNPNFGNELKLPISNFSIKILNKKSSYLSETEHFFASVLYKLSFEDFLLLFLAIFLEKSVVFVSEKASVVTGAISAFQALIYPFKWSHLVFYSVPESSLEVLRMKIPSLFGICVNSSIALNQIMPIDDNSKIWAFLDLGLVFCPESVSSSIAIPKFDGFLIKSQKIFVECFSETFSPTTEIAYKNTDVSNVQTLKTISFDEFFKLADMSAKSNFKKPVIYERQASRSLDREDLCQIFFYFRFFLNSFLISRLPRKKQDEKDTSISIDLRKFSESESDIEFLKLFFETKAFQNFYHNELSKASSFQIAQSVAGFA